MFSHHKDPHTLPLSFYSSNGRLRQRRDPPPSETTVRPQRNRHSSSKHNNPAPLRENLGEKTSHRQPKEEAPQTIQPLLHLPRRRLRFSLSTLEPSPMPPFLGTHLPPLFLSPHLLHLRRSDPPLHQRI